jgi:hypothetical protein
MKVDTIRSIFAARTRRGEKFFSRQTPVEIDATAVKSALFRAPTLAFHA